jgi:hypothetical protein
METGFHVNQSWIEIGFRFRLGNRRPLGGFLRAFWRWLRETVGVRLGFPPPRYPSIGPARVQSLDEGFAAYRQLRGVTTVERAPAPPPARRTPSTSDDPEEFERFRTTRLAAPRPRSPRPPRRRDLKMKQAQRRRRPSGTGDCFFGVTSTRRQEIRGATREWRKEVEPDTPLPE